MTRTSGYALWLMPAGEVYERLTAIISRLSREYYTPAFEPHITLSGSLAGAEDEILSKASDLAAHLRPYEVHLTSVGSLEAYFQCLFIKVRETEEVRAANQEARKAFHRELDPQYSPHLSLMYGNLTRGAKEEIIAELETEFNLRFPVRSIHVWAINGEPKDWYKVRELPLGGQRPWQGR